LDYSKNLYTISAILNYRKRIALLSIENSNVHFYIDAGEASADVPEGEENKTKNDITVEGTFSSFCLFYIYYYYLLFLRMYPAIPANEIHRKNN